MIQLNHHISQAVKAAVRELYNSEADISQIQVQKTRKEFRGDYTVVVFSLLKLSRKKPEDTASEIGEYLQSNLDIVSDFNVVKGFLNLNISVNTWVEVLDEIIRDEKYGFASPEESSPAVMIEYSSPNTNKPLHLGHIRNNLLGFSISRILEAVGRKVVKVNLINDRGIHICKSMLAWMKFGDNQTPESTGIKGDHLVGKYYVEFDKAYKAEVNDLINKGMSKKDAEQKSALLEEARALLLKWENNDKTVTDLWKMMNSWVYEGFERTYRQMGVDFDKLYYESETYKLGKELVVKGLKEGVFFQKEDGSVWINLAENGLDSKLLLRADGTSVYMTQDLGTAHQRFTEFNLDTHVYVVGNEQNYHFQVLALILKKLGFQWAEKLFHLSYGMVELPEGKMKSREGTVVDADDLMDEMIHTAESMSDELGKLSEVSMEQKEKIYYQVGMGALKYFILKVDPKKNMTFNPSESVDFNGNTGPFIQYTYARIQSVLRKSEKESFDFSLQDFSGISQKEKDLIRLLYYFPELIDDAAKELNPAIIANYMYEVAREFNQFYHDHSILNAENAQTQDFRLALAASCAKVIVNGMYLLGIEVPERM